MLTSGAALKEIPLAAVDLKDHPFTPPCLSPSGPARLRESLAAVGLLAPPWLRAKAPGGDCQLVAGGKRLQAAAELGWEKLPGFVLPADTPDVRCLLISLMDNALIRGFTPLEQVYFAPRLLNHWDRDTVIKKILPCLGLPPSPRHLERLLAAANLGEPWQTLLGSGRLALTAAARLSSWAPPDQTAAWPYLSALPFSQSKQEEFLDWAELLARREGVSVAEILSRPELTRHLTEGSLNPQERAAGVRRLLKGWVYPNLSAAEDSFRRGLARLGLGSHPRLHLAPPPAFEGPDFELTVKFRDAPELQGLLQELLRLAREREFSQLTSL